jgi:hypothetical protein
MAAFALAQAAFVPLTPGVQPFWSGLVASMLVGLGMAVPLLQQGWGGERRLKSMLAGGAGAALGAALGRTIGVTLVPISDTSEVTRIYLFPTLNADTVNVALRAWHLGDRISLSFLAVLLQVLTGLLLGLGIMGGMSIGQYAWRQFRDSARKPQEF